MAKNYTLKEAANIIAEGKKKNEIMEIGKRFPLLAISLSSVIAQAGNNFLDFINYMPDHITANKINSAMKADVDAEDVVDVDFEETDETETEETPEKSKKSEKSAKKAEADSTDYSKMSGPNLYNMIKEAGKLADLKSKGFSTKKPGLLEYLEKFPLDGAEADNEESEAEEETKYDDMSAIELFKECKKRGIKTAPKKPAKFYIELLEKDDVSKADESEAEEDEDWDSEEPEEKPAKKTKGKSAKKAEPEEEEDDDWDI